jgi:hypothetical protein
MSNKIRKLNPDTEAHLIAKLEDAGCLGEAMKALPSDRMRLFVLASCAQTFPDNSAAARQAGYQGNANALHVVGNRLSTDPRIRAAILEQSKRQLQSYTPMAVRTLGAIAANESVKPMVRVRAAEGILNRAGLHEVSEHKVEVSHTESRLDKLKKIAEFAKAAGIPLRNFLGNMVDTLPDDLKLLEAENAES